MYQPKKRTCTDTWVNSQYDVSVWAAARGFAFGTVGSALGLALAQPRVATVRTLPTSIKVTTVILSGMACGVANAERAGIAYDVRSLPF